MKLCNYDGNANLIPTRTLDIYVGDNLLDSDIITQLNKKMDTIEIYWSDSMVKHWCFDFKINDVWFSINHISDDLKTFEIICSK